MARELALFVNRIADTARRGGRCSAVDDTRCILYDCGNWTSEMHDAVLRRYPVCCITVSAFESSVSGFIVVFDLGARPGRLGTTFLVLGLAAALAIVTAYVHHALAPALAPWPRALANATLFAAAPPPQAQFAGAPPP